MQPKSVYRKSDSINARIRTRMDKLSERKKVINRIKRNDNDEKSANEREQICA